MASHEGEVAVDIGQYSTFCTNEFYGYANEGLAVGVSDVAANTVILSLLFCLLSVFPPPSGLQLALWQEWLAGKRVGSTSATRSVTLFSYAFLFYK